MGERGANREAANPADLARMRALSHEAMQAGALGFSTSRLAIHCDANGGQIPSFDADVDELKAICAGMQDVGCGTFQVVLDIFGSLEREYALIESITQASGRPATFTLLSANDGSQQWRHVLDMLTRSQHSGARVTAQVMSRPIGLIGGLELSMYPFILCPSWRKIAHLPLTNQLAAMRASQAAARGVHPEEFVYDCLVESEGRGLFMTMAANYGHGRLDSVHEMLSHPHRVPGLGDGGAHYGAICDASFPTSLLKKFVNEDAELRFSLPQAAHMLSAKAAAAVGLGD